jgi:hypothetical protein
MENAHDFVLVNSELGYAKDFETAFKVIKDFEIRTTTRFASFYSKNFGKTNQGMKRINIFPVVNLIAYNAALTAVHNLNIYI